MSDSSHYYIFKEDRQALGNRLGIEIRIAHYLPHISKYNPIEHRLLPHINRFCEGEILENIQLLQELISATTTQTRLKVFTTILDKPLPNRLKDC